MKTIGTIGTIRPDATEEISAEGEDYTDARSANKKFKIIKTLSST